MTYRHGSERVLGVLTPVAGLRSAEDGGCGEFADLVALGRWCRDTGVRVVQILPVNDTGADSSPYSALSAFALHPIYIRIASIPEFAALPSRERTRIAARVAQLREKKHARFPYPEVLAEKLALLSEIFDTVSEDEQTDAAIADFAGHHPWVVPYAVFRALKDRNAQRHWREWEGETFRTDPGKGWDAPEIRRPARFYAWIQVRLAEQLAEAARTLDEMGVALKGDIPILMNDDSVDVWSDDTIFRTDLNAGAPPDMFSSLGQNWGFPVYNWEQLAARGYAWWRSRLAAADSAYHAFRIDHVLGFFRIWAIPSSMSSGSLGFFWPQHGFTRDELHSLGFDDGRIRWLAEPHVRGDDARAMLGEEWDTAAPAVFEQLDGEDLFVFAPAIAGERDIERLPVSSASRDALLTAFRDRALVVLPDGTMAPTWTFRDCSRYRILGDGERERFEDAVARHGASNNELWATKGHAVLEALTSGLSMLACAEDLGVVPEAVPRVLGGLGILGLRIPRWTAEWDRPGQPLVPFDRYPELTVCAPSVHDTSTLRDWWENESGREGLWGLVARDEPCPRTYTPETARTVLGRIAASGSRIVVVQIQDLLDLTEELRGDDPAGDRVNVPGTYNEFNWTWRLPLALEELGANRELATEVRRLVDLRS